MNIWGLEKSGSRIFILTGLNWQKTHDEQFVKGLLFFEDFSPKKKSAERTLDKL